MNEEKEERILKHQRRCKGSKTPASRKHATRPYDRRQRKAWRRDGMIEWGK